MATKEEQSTPERDRTNSSLGAERRHADDELAKKGSIAEERAHDPSGLRPRVIRRIPA